MIAGGLLVFKIAMLVRLAKIGLPIPTVTASRTVSGRYDRHQHDEHPAGPRERAADPVGTFLFSIASALIPVLNVEISLAAIPSAHRRALGLAAPPARARRSGKIIWYYAGIHSMRISWLAQEMETEKWQASYAKWNAGSSGGRGCRHDHVRLRGPGSRRWRSMAVLAGSLRMNLAVFISTVLVGRIIRFWFVIAGADRIRTCGPLVRIGTDFRGCVRSSGLLEPRHVAPVRFAA